MIECCTVNKHNEAIKVALFEVLLMQTYKYFRQSLFSSSVHTLWKLLSNLLTWLDLLAILNSPL